MTQSPDDPVFGADGGGTKTAGVIIDRGGLVLSQCQAAASNPNVVGIEGSARTLTDLLVSCCNEAGLSPGSLTAAVCGLAGAGAPSIRNRLLEALRSELQGRGLALPRLALETDARVALEGAFAGGPGSIVIAGTGSIVLGKSAAKVVDRVGGWGKLIGDEGSGYRLGLEAIRAVARDIDGRGEAAVLRSLFHERIRWTKREDIVTAVYQQDFSISSLAPLVLEAADGGDNVARTILEQQAAELVEQVRALLHRGGGTPPHEVVFVGGLIENDTSYSRVLKRILERTIQGVVVRPPQHPPAHGAALMARALEGSVQ